MGGKGRERGEGNCGEGGKGRLQYLTFVVRFLPDLHPCLKVHCGNYAKCKAYSSSNVQCDCEKVCPPYIEQKCDKLGHTYDNQCKFEQMVCKTGSHTNIVKNGSCEGKKLNRTLRGKASVKSHYGKKCLHLTSFFYHIRRLVLTIFGSWNKFSLRKKRLSQFENHIQIHSHKYE